MRHAFTLVELLLVFVDIFLVDENTSGIIKFLSVLNVTKCFQAYTYIITLHMMADTYFCLACLKISMRDFRNSVQLEHCT